MRNSKRVPEVGINILLLDWYLLSARYNDIDWLMIIDIYT